MANHGRCNQCLVFKRDNGVKTDIIVGEQLFQSYGIAMKWLMANFPETCKTEEDVLRLFVIRNLTRRRIMRSVRDFLNASADTENHKQLCLSILDFIIADMAKEDPNGDVQ